jgi:hypothetical protein
VVFLTGGEDSQASCAGTTPPPPEPEPVPPA